VARAAAPLSALVLETAVAVVFEDVSIASETGVRCTDCSNITFKNAKITSKTGSPFRFDNSRRITVDSSCAGAASECVELAGAETKDISVDGKHLDVKALVKKATAKSAAKPPVDPAAKSP